jgi:gamma-glutamyltranspeptidase / glutathione hydrolase
MAPAMKLPIDGFPAGEALSRAIGRQRARLQRGAGAWEVELDAIAPGVVVRQPTLDSLLERIGRDGRAAFYGGAIADAIERTVRLEHGALCPRDLREHRTVRSAPVSRSFAGATVHAQPPSSQALLALMALGELDGLESRDRNQRVHVAIEALEAAFAHPTRSPPQMPRRGCWGPRSALTPTARSAAADRGCRVTPRHSQRLT